MALETREGEGVPGLKIAIIGAGSIGFTRKLFADIVAVPELREAEFALTDISEHNLSMVRQILDRMVAANKLPTKITATTDRREARGWWAPVPSPANLARRAGPAGRRAAEWAGRHLGRASRARPVPAPGAAAEPWTRDRQRSPAARGCRRHGSAL